VHATDYRSLSLGELVESADLILLISLQHSNSEQLDTRVDEVLKGTPPPNLSLSNRIRSYASADGEESVADFGIDAGVILEGTGKTLQRLAFLRLLNGKAAPFHPHCMQPVAQMDRVKQLLSMRRNPAPFVASPKSTGDADFIYLLGVQFWAVHVTAPALPALAYLNRPQPHILEEVPWERTHLIAEFTFRSSRKPMLQLKPIQTPGPLPDFIRKMAATGALERIAEAAKDWLPEEFTVTIDTRGPERIGDLLRKDAATFLRAQLQSHDVRVISAAYSALINMMDLDSVPIAIEMLRSPDRKMQREAAMFLAYAKDTRSIEPLCLALDDLPPCVRYSRKGYDEDVNQLSEAIGRAVRNLRDLRTVPALKRAATKGSAGDWIAMTLSRLGDESAFEPLLSHLRDPEVDHYPSELVTMVKRSNLPVEAWMEENLSSDDHEGKVRRATSWIEWWNAHKDRFRIVRTWEEAYSASRG
jgi:hypothetical protein